MKLSEPIPSLSAPDEAANLLLPGKPVDPARIGRRLARQVACFRALFENLTDGVAVLDLDGCIVDVNRSFERLFGYSAHELRRARIDACIVPEDLRDEAETLSERLASACIVELDTERRRKDGARLPVRIRAFPILLDGRQAASYAVYADLTEAQRATLQMSWQATHDGLTAAFNRVEFERRLEALLNLGGAAHAMLYLDLDQFRVVNDIGGHRAGDELLRRLAALIDAELGEDDLLARLGGDQFGILLRNCDRSAAQRVAGRLIQVISSFRFIWERRTYGVGASIGVVGLDRDCATLPDVFAAAGAACWSAKQEGGNRVRLYRRDDREISRHRDEMNWVSRLGTALEENRFVLYHQTISPLKGVGDVRWYEILLRLRGESGTIITPGNFIPAAERYHLMPALDRWVVREVLTGLRRQLELRQTHGRSEIVAINISGESVSEAPFATFVREQFERFKVPPSMICFEITETAAIANLNQAIAFITEMRKLGCAISLDDFGSGLSSFTWLKTLHVDYLKIDGAFVRNMADDAVDCAMVETIDRVGKIMGIKTVAEYVEARGVLDKLRELGVDFAQGYDIHVPEPWQWSAVHA
ncbi:MAG TPA: EAL domain-containing protein [Gammaproteobacteria bacterium]|nr:EAL domain-containing protein [Gammaproteobacteria bacterium]